MSLFSRYLVIASPSSVLIQKAAFERSRATTFSQLSVGSNRFKALSREWHIAHFPLNISLPGEDPCAKAVWGRTNKRRRMHTKPRYRVSELKPLKLSISLPSLFVSGPTHRDINDHAHATQRSDCTQRKFRSDCSTRKPRKAKPPANAVPRPLSATHVGGKDYKSA